MAFAQALTALVRVVVRDTLSAEAEVVTAVREAHRRMQPLAESLTVRARCP